MCRAYFLAVKQVGWEVQCSDGRAVGPADQSSTYHALLDVLRSRDTVSAGLVREARDYGVTIMPDTVNVGYELKP